MRSELWNPDNFVDPASLPTPGLLLKAAKAEFDQETYDREWSVVTAPHHMVFAARAAHSRS
jgi:uncharacterized protein